VKKLLVGALVCPLFVVLAAFLLAAPAELAWETVELLRLDATASGVVKDVTIARAGDPRLVRSLVRYAFHVDGREYLSDRVVPGVVERLLFSFDGDALGQHYRPGQRVTVYYRRLDPKLCSLEYGWYVATFAVTAILGGLLLRGLATRRSKPSLFGTALSSAGAATTLYGVVLPVVVDSAVRLSELPWHILAWGGLVTAVMLFTARQEEPLKEDPARRSSWEFVFGDEDD
jgi:Protein of unknown function (DUF3592)